MADIDKGLPNVKRPEDEIVEENFEEVDVAEELGKGPVEVTEDEMGATIDFDPNQVDMPDEGDPFANLNDLLPEDITDRIGNQLQNDYRELAEMIAESEARDRIAEAGGVSKMADGGIMNLKKKW